MFELSPAPVADWLTIFEEQADTPAVRVKMAPIGPSALRAARAALTDSAHPIEEFANDAGFDAFCRELCRRSILDWEGIGIAGAVADLTAENIDRLVGDSRIMSRLQVSFIYPYLEREAEKNASAPSSNGTSQVTTGAKVTAKAARPGAKSAPTSSTRPKAAKAKPAGK